jgi:ribosome-binding protein aMBF1 (putative translation factor)
MVLEKITVYQKSSCSQEYDGAEAAVTLTESEIQLCICCGHSQSATARTR